MIKYAYYFYITVAVYNESIPNSAGAEDFFKFAFKHTTFEDGRLLRFDERI